MTEADIARAAARLAVAPVVIRVVLAVESAGAGFLPDCRPKILFESHIFDRLTRGRFRADHPTVSTAKWDRATYGRAGAHQYDRLAVALGLDREAAIRSASWGLGQILGENFRLAGFLRAALFVDANVESEGRQLDAFAAFIERRGLADELRDLRWADFAAGFNGAGYRANAYDVKLAADYARRMAEAQRGTDHPPNEERDLWRMVQAALNVHGAGLAVDGWPGPKTDAALVDFQRAAGIAESGDLDDATMAALGLPA